MTAFKNLNEETFYWFGLLFADGSANGQKDYVNRVSFKSKDYALAKAYADYVGRKPREVKGERSVVYEVVFQDKEIRERLYNLGLEWALKKDRQLPPLPNGMERHFLRGYFDGDGSIHKDHRKPNCWRLEVSTHPAYTEDMKELLEYFCTTANIRAYSRTTSDRLMVYNVAGVKEILKFLYKDVTVAPHPKVKAESVKSLIEGIL